MITAKLRVRHALFGVVILLVLAQAAAVPRAQWSIGAPGNREAPPGLKRWAWLVFANPVPGLEHDFNEWYQNTHMGDLVQIPGVTGAQRFRIVAGAGLNPRPTRDGYRHGYLMVWDQEDKEPSAARKLVTAAIAGGKSRRGAGFDYIGGVGAGGTFEVLGPRITRPDGKGPFLPAVSDSKTPRPNRYIVLDFANAAGGSEREFDAAMNQRIKDVLALPGWMAAQRFAQVPPEVVQPENPAPTTKPKYLTIWEVEGTVQAAQGALDAAMKAGRVKAVPSDPTGAEFTYWEPITPHITREDFVR